MKHGPIRIAVRLGLAAVLVGALSALPALASNPPPPPPGLHVVASPFINNSSLSASAAITANDIWAVGEFPIANTATQPLAEHFNGTSWSVVSTPALNGTFTGVAGATSTDVWAVGNQAAGKSVNTLIEHWNGTSWGVVSSPKLPDGSELRGVTARLRTTSGRSASTVAPPL
jgi:hypothetical protein